MSVNKLYNEDCVIGIKRIPTGSIDAILTDPPYLYLKNQKLDKEFDEDLLFKEWYRVLKPGGLIAIFGRGVSFARWITKLDAIGFVHKEDMVWDKCNTSSPFMRLSRIHENFVIMAKDSGVINASIVPYINIKQYDISSIRDDINRLAGCLKDSKKLKYLQEFLSNNILNEEYHDIIRTDLKHSTTSMKFNIAGDNKSVKVGNRAVSVLKAMEYGLKERSIITERRDHFGAIHPTQKSIGLLIRILNLISKKGDLVLDCFSGSGSTAVACMKSGRDFIGFELDEEYYDKSIKRIHSEKDLFTF